MIRPDVCASGTSTVARLSRRRSVTPGPSSTRHPSVLRLRRDFDKSTSQSQTHSTSTPGANTEVSVQGFLARCHQPSLGLRAGGRHYMVPSPPPSRLTSGVRTQTRGSGSVDVHVAGGVCRRGRYPVRSNGRGPALCSVSGSNPQWAGARSSDSTGSRRPSNRDETWLAQALQRASSRPRQAPSRTSACRI